jgi:hypothetical protein
MSLLELSFVMATPVHIAWPPVQNSRIRGYSRD